MDTEKELRVAELLKQGEALGALKEYDKALALFKQAEEVNPEEPKIYIDQAVAYMMLEKFNDAMNQLDKAQLLDENNGMVYYQRGNVHFYRKEYELSCSSLEKAIALGVKSKNCYFQTASAYLALQKFEDALFYYNKTLQVDPYDSKALVRKIEVLLRTEKFSEAYSAACNVVDKRPDAFEGYHYMFLTLLQMKKPDKAQGVLDAAIERFPNDLGFQYDYMVYYDQIGRPDKALEVIETYLESDEKNKKKIRRDKARAYYKIRNYDAAEAIAMELLQEDYQPEMAYYVMLSRLAHNDLDVAIQYARMIKENKKENALEPYYASLYYEGVIMMKQGKSEEAKQVLDASLKELRLACVNEPGRVNLYVYRALGYKAVGDLKRALEMADFLINLTKGNFIEAYYIRAMIYDAMGETEKAYRDNEKVKASNSLLNTQFY